MALVIVLSEEALFSFDEKCLYIDKKPCEEKLDGLPFHVLKYLAQNSPSYKTCEAIFHDVWVVKLGKERPVNDASIRDKISIIRSYLGDDTKPYQFIQTSDGEYRCTKSICDTDIREFFGKKPKSKGTKAETPPDISPAKISDGLDFSNARNLAYTRKIERAKRVIEELTQAFEALVVAQSENDVEIARVKIINSIRQCPTYAYFILELLEDDNSDDVVLSLPWDEVSIKLKAELIGMIDHYERTLERNLSEGLGDNPEIESIKIDLLLGFREGWHIMVSFLEETLRREQENLRLAESQLQKEFVQNLIKKTELKLDLARDRAVEEDRTFDTAMISYRQTSSIDKPIV